MSFTTTLFPIIAALVAPEGKYFDAPKKWSPINSTQSNFIEHFYNRRNELSFFNENELKSWASNDYTYLNNLAKAHGFNIQLDPFSETEIGSLSILDIKIKWLFPGKATVIKHNQIPYQAVRLQEGIEILSVQSYPHPIAKIATQGQDTVYLTQAEYPAAGFALLEKIDGIKNAFAESQPTGYGALIFPEVKHNQEVDISWLLGLYCEDKASVWRITQALQQTKFSMDTEGAHAESAVMQGMARSCLPSVLAINTPFYVWIERPGCTMPVFAGYINEKDWQKAS